MNNKLKQAFREGFVKSASTASKALKVTGIGGLGLGGIGAGGYYGGTSYLNSTIDDEEKEVMERFVQEEESGPEFFDTYVRDGSRLMNIDIAGQSGEDFVLNARNLGDTLGLGPPVTENTDDHYRAFAKGPLSARKQITEELVEGKIPALDKSMKRYEKIDMDKDKIKSQFNTLEKEFLDLAEQKYGEQYKSVDEIPYDKQRELEMILEENPEKFSEKARKSKQKLNEISGEVYGPAHEAYSERIGDPILNVID